jgi:PAS domain S-box-containing protein
MQEKREYNVLKLHKHCRGKRMSNTAKSKYRFLFENMLDGFAYHKMIFDQTGKPVDYVFLEVNKSFERLTGFKRDKVIGKKVTEVLPGIKKDPADWIGTFGKVAKTGQPIRFENFSQNLKKWYSISAYSPEKGYFATTFEDITERKQVEKALRKSKQEWERTFDSIPDLIAILDNQHKIVRANRAMADRLGVTPEQCIGLKCFECLHETNQPLESCPHTLTLQDGREHIAEVHEDRLGGDFLVSTTPLRDEQGQIVGSVHIARDITERKELEMRLSKSESKYRTLYETSRDGIVQTNRTGRIVECNQAYADMLGYSKEELLGLTYQQLTPKKWRQMENEIVNQSWEKTGYSPVYEKEFVRKDRSVFPVSIRVWLVRDENGKPIGMWSMVRDITRRKQAEEAVTREKNVLKGIMENTDAMFVYLDPAFNFVAVNSAYEKGSGYSAEELIGKNHFALFPNAENQAIFEKVRDTGKTVEYRDKPFEFADQPKRGVTYWNWTLAPIKDETGNVQGLVLSLMETTHRKELEMELLETLEVSQQRESEISALLKASKAVLYHRDFQHVAREIFGACKELIGASAGYVALLSEDEKENEVLFLDSGGLPCTVNRNLPMPIRGLRGVTYNSGKVAYSNDFLHSEWAKLMPEGHVNLKNVLFAPLIIDKKIVGIIGLANKLNGFTERDAAMALAFGEIASIALINSRMLDTLMEDEKRLKAYTENLEEIVVEETKKLKEAERLAAIGETAGMVGHDIRNPLQAITSSAYLAKEELKTLPESTEKEGLKESVDTIEEQVTYIDKIVSDLQDFVKPLNPKIEACEPHKLANDALLNMAIPENIKVLILIEDDLPHLFADKYFIKRVLINLITNAIQAMPDGGTLKVEAAQENGMVLISVEDTGLGIPEENRNKIFKPLFTTKSKGQGFGLAVCKRLVEAHDGGSISFESKVGKGSKFTVKVPIKTRKPKDDNN